MNDEATPWGKRTVKVFCIIWTIGRALVWDKWRLVLHITGTEKCEVFMSLRHAKDSSRPLTSARQTKQCFVGTNEGQIKCIAKIKAGICYCLGQMRGNGFTLRFTSWGQMKNIPCGTNEERHLWEFDMTRSRTYRCRLMSFYHRDEGLALVYTEGQGLWAASHLNQQLQPFFRSQIVFLAKKSD